MEPMTDEQIKETLARARFPTSPLDKAKILRAALAREPWALRYLRNTYLMQHGAGHVSTAGPPNWDAEPGTHNSCMPQHATAKEARECEESTILSDPSMGHRQAEHAPISSGLNPTFERFMCHLVGLGAIGLCVFCLYVGFNYGGKAELVLMCIPASFFGFHAWGYMKWLQI